MMTRVVDFPRKKPKDKDCDHKTYFNVEITHDDKGKFVTEIYEDNELVVCYGNINTQTDAYLVGEAFLDGIAHSIGEL